jgi:hypothetical protein
MATKPSTHWCPTSGDEFAHGGKCPHCGDILEPIETAGAFSIFDCTTHERVSSEVYRTADDANHDYFMNAGHTYVGPVPSPSPR